MRAQLKTMLEQDMVDQESEVRSGQTQVGASMREALAHWQSGDIVLKALARDPDRRYLSALTLSNPRGLGHPLGISQDTRRPRAAT